MQEEVNEKSIAFAVKAGKMTASVLVKAFQKFLQSNKSGKTKDGKYQPGKTSMKKLSEQYHGDLSNIEISDKNIKAFDPIAREFGITYSLKKAGNDRYYVFFNAKSADAMTAAFKKFTAQQTRQTTRPSVIKELRKLVEQVKNMAVSKTKHKDRGQEL